MCESSQRFRSYASVDREHVHRSFHSLRFFLREAGDEDHVRNTGGGGFFHCFHFLSHVGIRREDERREVGEGD